MERAISDVAASLNGFNRQMMVNFFLRIYDYFQQRKRLCYVLMTVIIGMLVVMVSSLKYNEDINDFLPMDKNQQKAITLYQDITGGQRIVAMMKMKDGDSNSDRLAEAVDTFTHILNSHDGVRHIKEVVSQVDFEKIAGIADFAYQNMPVMLADSDYVRMESILSDPEKVSDQLQQDVQLVMMPASGPFANNISNDPLGLFTPVLQRMQSRQSAMPFEMENGYIFTSDKRYAIVMMTSAYGSMESANNSLLVNYVDSVCQQTMARLPDVDIAITGSPVIAVDNASQIKADSQLAIAISVVLILCLLISSFRSTKNLLLIGVSIAFGWLFAMAFMAVLRSNVSLIVLGVGSIIIGIAVNYPLHFIAHIAHGGNIREVLKDMVSPLLIGNITTVGAFASLIPLDAPALRDLGLFAAFMLIGTILFVLVFLPHLVKKDKEQKEERLLFGRLSSVTPKIHRWSFGLILLLTAVFGYFSLGTSFDSDMHHINYLTPTQERLLADLHISAGLKDTANVYVVTEGETWDEALEARSRLKPLLDSLASKKEVASYSDITAFIGSEKLQQQRIGKWDAFWTKHRQEVIRLLQQQAPQYGFSEEAFEAFTDIISNEYKAQPFAYYEPLVTSLFTQSFSASTGRCSVVDVVDVGSGDVSEVEKVINGKTQDEGYSFDFVGMNSAVANALSDDFNYIGFACGFIVFVFLWLSFGRLELSILAFLPMALGWIWILGIMNICDMQFNIVNVILATFIFGQGDDYTIFMTDGLINEYAYRKKLLPSYKNSIIISALIMFIGMGSLIVAKHPALHSLAEVTIVGMLTVVLMAWIVPPMVFNWLVNTDGHVRKFPVTIEQIVRTSLFTVIYLVEVAYGCVLGFLLKLLPVRRETKQRWFNNQKNKLMRANVHAFFGVRVTVHNPHQETFNKGCLIVSNHQSILDPILMLALHPRVLILISEKVWKNPLVHTIFKVSGFIQLNQSIETLKEDIAQAVNKGYHAVIFPEGQRNYDKITRFHRGAFYITQEIGADILPVCIHGVGQVMPKGSAFASRGQIDISVGKRVSAEDLVKYGDSHLQMASRFHDEMKQQYELMSRQIETTHYYHDMLISKYIYKGWGLEQETRAMLKRYDDFSQWIDAFDPDQENHQVVSVINAAHGQFSLLFAWVHEKTEVHSYVTDPDDEALAQACIPKPDNLEVHLCNSEQEMLERTRDTYVINFADIVK